MTLYSLQKGVEAFCREETTSRQLFDWGDGGKKFRLEHHLNEAGRLILLVHGFNGKRF